MRPAQLLRNGNAVRAIRPFWNFCRAQKFGGTSQKREALQSDPYEGNFSFAECDQHTKVSVIGAAGRVGKTLSLLLKTCPLIDHLCLFDTDKSVKGVGMDISHIDTKCNVSYVCGMRNIQQALDAPDIVVIAAGCPASPILNGKKLFEKNAPIIAGISEACARFCPKACIILITSPINSLLPVIGSVYEIITNRIPSRRLFGLTSLDVVRANTFVAEVVRKDPSSVIVPVIGGTSQDTIVPVISQMKPCCKIKRGETVALTECLRRAEENLMDCQNCGTRGASSLSTAYAGFRFTSSLVMALKGAEDVIECAFVKSDVIPELEYLASPLKLGIRGIEYNFGYPRLSDYEVSLMEQAALALINDIEMGKCFVERQRKKDQKKIYRRCTPKKDTFLDICSELPKNHCCLEEDAPPVEGCCQKKNREKPYMIEALCKSPVEIGRDRPRQIPIHRSNEGNWQCENQPQIQSNFFSKAAQWKCGKGRSKRGKKGESKKIHRKEFCFYKSIELEENLEDSEGAKRNSEYYEVVALQQSVPALISDIEMGKTYVANIQDTVHKGLIWKRLTEENGKGDESKAEIRGKDLPKRRRPEEKTEKLPIIEAGEGHHRPRTLKQEVYTQGVRNWAAQASLDRFFGSSDHVRENCNEIEADSILDSGTCRDDPSFRKPQFMSSVPFIVYLKVEKPLAEFSEEKPVEENVTRPDFSQIVYKPSVKKTGLLQRDPRVYQPARSYYTAIGNHGSSKRGQKYFLDYKKMLVPVKTSTRDWEKQKIRRAMAWNTLRTNQYKNLNASAKQKFRSFNSQKKFMPSASVLLVLDKQKRMRASKSTDLVVAEAQSKKAEEEKKSEETKAEEDEKSEDKELAVRKEQNKYKEFIFRQIRELKKENEDLKKQLSKLSEDKRLESVLQSQSDRLELERTKLKACWLIMSSTMDAFSNFCKKFTGKSDTKQQEEEEEEEEMELGNEEFDDALESVEEESFGDATKGKERKTAKYDEKYYKFLQKLMEDQIETQLEDCKRIRMRK